MRKSFIYRTTGHAQKAIDEAIIKAALMGILDDTKKPKKNKRWP